MKTKKSLFLAGVLMIGMTLTNVTMTSCVDNEDNAVLQPDIPGDGQIPGDGASGAESGQSAVQPGPDNPVPVIDDYGDPNEVCEWKYNTVKDIGLSLDKSSNYNGHWFGFDGYNFYDASKYDYIWIVYSGNTGVFLFGVNYNMLKSDGTYYFDMDKFMAPSGIAYIKLDKTKPVLHDVFTQDDGEEVSMTLEGLWIGTEKGLRWALDKYERGQSPLPSPSGGGDEPVIGPANQN